ncbi:DUF488 domain-containing protein [Staphylococcus muscae]|uniref:Putative cytosolic protein n=1 Tax=Staphylococcus muscae TaxID=1294 RepID=A0A240C987_9STAP|nr:DUF488 family protein [Staphylococcus muscae]AVQ33841.1 DUF488 domain-containing protein [Staphylococcus muscae]PNZ06162.1 DUF488 domain-containing protein [Staphylococcus muscae]GGA94970.1 hypothetical protein GCM10007183_18910 [Staphylococcus muscae]SNW04419.1 Putative cytosolic protein [Staphylococcus muscae]
MTIKIERIYNKQPSKGLRILVDRVWPRGVSKKAAQLDQWLKEVGPTKELRQWFDHDPDKFESFKEKYISELQHNDKQHAAYQELVDMISSTDETPILLYAAKDTTYNHAIILRDCLEHNTIKAQ